MAALEEVKAAVEGALAVAQGIPVTATLSFDSHGERSATRRRSISLPNRRKPS